MAQHIRIGTDENIVRGGGVGANKLNAEPPHRAALGDMVNRLRPTAPATAVAAANKKSVLAEINPNPAIPKKTYAFPSQQPYVSYVIGQAERLKVVKPKVDTHWKRQPLAVKPEKPDVPTAGIKSVKLQSTQRNAGGGGVVGGSRGGVGVIEKVRVNLVEPGVAVPRQVQRIQRITNATRQESTLNKVVLSRIKKDTKSTVTTTSKDVLPVAASTAIPKLVPISSRCASVCSLSSTSSSGNSIKNDDEAYDTIGSSLITNEFKLHTPGKYAHSTLLLNDIYDIDRNDENSLVLISEYVNDIYAYLYNLERAMPIRKEFLDRNEDVTPKMRAVLIDWINEVHFQFKLVNETFFMAVSIIDRYLQIVTNTKRGNLQLVGVTALFLASKYEELYPPEIKDFVYITDDTYNRKDILEMERQIIKKLDFQLGRPHPIQFLRRYSKAANSNSAAHQMAKYFLELMSIQYSFVHFRPSQMAAASILLAQHLCTNEPLHKAWTKTLQYYSTYTLKDLIPIVKQLANIVKNVHTNKLQAVFNKYKLTRFDEIAAVPQLSGSMIDDLCSVEEIVVVL